MRRTLLASSLLLFAGTLLWPGCSRQHKSESFSPSAPEFADALVLSTLASEIPANGFSRAAITARITGGADLDRRRVKFTTDNGDFPPTTTNPATPASNTRSVDVDSQGVATVELRSSTSPTPATVTAQVMDTSGNTEVAVQGLISRITIDFTPAESGGIIALSASTLTSDADGATTVFIHADIDPEVPLPNSVEFTTTMGVFINGTLPNTNKTSITPDIGRRATAALKSPSMPGEALVTAKITTPATTEEVRILFDPALPEVIVVNLSKTKLDRTTPGTSDQAVVNLILSRSQGSVSTGLAIDYSGFEKAYGQPLDFLFFDQSLTLAGDPVTANAKVALGTIGFEGTATIRARVGGVSGEADIEIDAPAPQPDISVTPGNLDFGMVPINTDDDQQITVTNTGEELLVITSIHTSGGEFSVPVLPPLPTELVKDQDLVLTVRFSPTAVGPQSGTLVIDSNDPQEGELAVSLTGEGM